MSAMVQFLREAALCGSVLIAVLLLLRAAFRKYVSPRVWYALWLTAALCLLVPMRVASPLSLLNAVPVSAVQGERGASVLPVVPSGSGAQNLAEVPEEVNEILSGKPEDETDDFLSDPLPIDDTAALSDRPQASKRAFPWQTALFALWAAGAAGMLGWILWSNVRFSRRVRRSMRPTNVEPPKGVRAVVESAAVPSPCLLGLVRPVIVITPETRSDEQRLSCVLLHETCHFSRRDNWFSLLRCLCLIVHWFNPLVWLGAAASREDCELSCDERVLQKLNPQQSIAYGETLVASLREGRRRMGNLVNAATAMSQSRSQIARRIGRIVKKPKNLLSATVLAIVLCLCACAATLTGANDKEAPSSTANMEEDVLAPEQTAVVPKPEIAPEQGGDVPDNVREEMNAIESLLPSAEFFDMDEGSVEKYLAQFNGDFVGYGRTTAQGDAYVLLQPAPGSSWPQDGEYGVSETYDGKTQKFFYNVSLYREENGGFTEEPRYTVSGVQGLEFSKTAGGDYTMGYLLISAEQSVFSSYVFPYSWAWIQYAVERRLSYLKPEGACVELAMQDEDLIEKMGTAGRTTFYIALSDAQKAELEALLSKGMTEVSEEALKKQNPSYYETGVYYWRGDGTGYQLFNRGMFAAVTTEDYYKPRPDCQNTALSDWLRALVKETAQFDPAEYDPSWFDEPLQRAVLSYQVLENGYWTAKEQIVTDGAKLESLRSLLKNAQLNSSAACPMVVSLLLTRQDGAELSMMLAGDSCGAGLIQGNVYFDYGDQNRLKAIFDQDVWWE